MGPASESREMIEKLLKAGMNIMRLNFSHGDFEEHGRRITNLRAVNEETGLNALVLQDLAGPKIRIGAFSSEYIELEAGQNFVLTTEEIVGDINRVSVNYKTLHEEVSSGHHIFVHDGKKKLEVLEIKEREIICKVLVGGKLGHKRGVNLPDSELSTHALTEKDKRDLEFGIKENVDFIALSFVRKPEDVEELRAILNERGSKAKIISKIETPQAIKNIDSIIEKSDGIMVARGDLAIEVPFEKVPLYQKEIIEKCNRAGKFVVTATQMLEAMIHHPVPTRAEVSDVANAILDGTDAIMLSEETSLGVYPVESVSVMARIAEEVEQNYPDKWKRGAS